LRVLSRTRRLCKDEQGSFLTTVIILAIFIAVITVAVIDGASVFYAYRSAGDVSEAAARAAEFEFKQNKNDNRAMQAAVSYCEDKGLTFEDFKVLNQPFHGYEVSCSADAKTYVFYRLPWLKNMIHLVGTGRAFD